MTTEAEIAWAAGLFEGEGSCFGSVRGDRPNTTRIRMNLRMTDRDVVERFASIVGVGSLYGPIQHIRSSDRKRLKDVFEWSTGSWYLVEKLYASFRPWLGSRRRVQFENALATAKPKGPQRQRAVGPKPAFRYKSRTEIMRT